MEKNDIDFRYKAKGAFIWLFVIITLIGLYIIAKCKSVEAAEVDQEVTVIQEEESFNQEEESTEQNLEEVGADEQLLSFGYLTKSEDAAVTLARIYNLLLTLLYVFLINIGRQVITRNLRKGYVKNGLVE